MKRVWVIVIAVLLMITVGCGNTTETQKVSLQEEVSTGISVEDQDSVPVDGSSLFQPVKGSEQNQAFVPALGMKQLSDEYTSTSPCSFYVPDMPPTLEQ